MLIRDQGRQGGKAGGRILRSGSGPFPIGPAVIAATMNDVNFLPSPLPHVPAVEKSRHVIKRDPPRVAQSDREHLGAHGGGGNRVPEEGGGPHERVVGRYPVLN